MEKNFESKLSESAKSMKASEIRELLKLTAQPEIISFAGGLPAAELFPIDKIKKAAEELIEKDGRRALQYSTTEGFNELRNVIIKQRLEPMGIKAGLENILITSGSQQALDYSSRIFVNPGDTIITESPSYLGALNAFKLADPNFVEIEMDDQGMKMDKLEEALKTEKNVKFIYTIPDFQNPSGVTMNLERRKKLIELANKYDVLVLEDCPYKELIFDGEPLPALKSMDTEGRVIHLGTFSKTFCPGLRIGWIVADPFITNKYTMLKQGSDLQSSSLDQLLTAKFMEDNILEEHIKKIVEVYKKRRDVMFAAIDKYFPKGIKYTKSEGGLFTWVEVKPELQSKEILEKALEKKVAFVPGDSFFPNGGKTNFFRMNYSCMSEEKIEEGIKLLGEVLDEYYK